MIWSAVPEIQSKTNWNCWFQVIFCPFTPNLKIKILENEKMPSDICIPKLWLEDMVRGRCNYFSVWANSPKITIKKNEKAAWRYQAYDQMLYGYWDMVRDRCNGYFLFWAIFYPFTPPNSLKNQNFEKMKKKNLEVSSFYICVPKIMFRWCTIPEIWCMTNVIIFPFGLFFPLLHP